MRRNPARTVVLCVGGAVCVVYVAAFLGSFWFKWIQAPSMFALCVRLAGTAVMTFAIWRFIPKFPAGCCQQCGYNLTGLPEPRCPECGQPFVPKGDAP